MNNKMKKELITAKKVSEYLQIPVRTVQHLSQTGRIKAIRIGGRWKYVKEDIEKYLSFGTDFSKEPERKPDPLTCEARALHASPQWKLSDNRHCEEGPRRNVGGLTKQSPTRLLRSPCSLAMTDRVIGQSQWGEVNKPVECRAYPRINSNFKCKYSVNYEPIRKAKGAGEVKNISAGGVFVIGRDGKVKNIYIDDPISLDFVLNIDDGESINIHTKGRVVRKTDNGLGIKFRSISKEYQDEIARYVG